MCDNYLSLTLSTASSDISDWTNEAGLNIISPSRKRTRRIHRR